MVDIKGNPVVTESRLQGEFKQYCTDHVGLSTAHLVDIFIMD